ncbi:5'-methylthioadenosine/S-adenosylhomocysteine nucleosidase [Mycolicibacterium sphagni]|nr:5'-methylthioadenosine/S-adenosylhomocysteine nucleosidase [Mycolicibacterium sphagni]
MGTWLRVAAAVAGLAVALLIWPATASAAPSSDSQTGHGAHAQSRSTPPPRRMRAAATGSSARKNRQPVIAAPPQTESPANNPQPRSEPERRTLVLTAFPAEADAVLARTTLDPDPSVVVDGRHFYLGELGGKKVVVAMTGIGMVNATNTTQAAFDHFTPDTGIAIGAVVFVGVAGGSGRTSIGAVAVPARWTSDDGQTWHPVDAGMLAAANSLTVDLKGSGGMVDPAIACGLLNSILRIDLRRTPQLFTGGDGSSDDNNNGTAFPTVPLGGWVFGPQPLRAPDFSPLFTGNFFQAIGPFLAKGLIGNITGYLASSIPPVDAVDQETAAAQQVADSYGVPFLGIRGISDGPGDPLRLPGIPFLQFFVYGQIAADNAATVAEAFLQTWAPASAA